MYGSKVWPVGFSDDPAAVTAAVAAAVKVAGERDSAGQGTCKQQRSNYFEFWTNEPDEVTEPAKGAVDCLHTSEGLTAADPRASRKNLT